MKAIIPAAGLGTRMLPVTKVVPKELLLVEGKPAIQWVMEEAFDAGLREFVLVISPRKKILREYLTQLEPGHPLIGHTGLDEIERLLRSVEITFVEQPEPLGLGDAILRCRDPIAGKPFVLVLPDNVCTRKPRLIEHLINLNSRCNKSCLALRRAVGAGLSDGAIIAEPWQDDIYEIRRVLPKRSIDGVATDIRGIGRYLLEPATFDFLERAQTTGEPDEIPALDGLARSGQLLGLLVADDFCHIGASLN